MGMAGSPCGSRRLSGASVTGHPVDQYTAIGSQALMGRLGLLAPLSLGTSVVALL